MAPEYIFEAALMRCPLCSIPAHPPYGFDEFLMEARQRARKDGLMVRDPVSEATQGIEAAMGNGPFDAPFCKEGLVQPLSPECCVVAGANQSDPERKTEFSNNLAWPNTRAQVCCYALDILDCIAVKRSGAVSEPVVAIKSDHLLMQCVTKTYLQ